MNLNVIQQNLNDQIRGNSVKSLFSIVQVRAVYGHIDNFEALSPLTAVTHWLGRTKVVKATRVSKQVFFSITVGVLILAEY